VRRLALEGLDAVLVERSADILNGASKGNSALLHTGFDAPAGSLELRCMQAGYQEYMEIKDRLNLPILETDAAVVAWTDEELARLESIEERAHANGVAGVRRMGRSELLEREPHLSPALVGALLVPGEHVIDPWSAPLAYLGQAVANGAETMFSAEVVGGEFSGGAWCLETTRGCIRARVVINCAGLFGDIVEERLLGQAHFTIRPRKGQFVIFDKAASRLMRTTILPVPDKRTKGIVLARTIFGNVLVGPTAEEQDDRERASVDHETLDRLVERAVAIVPALSGMPVTAVYAGLRPASELPEYRIVDLPDRHWISVGGIRSTGLTAALGLARHVLELLRSHGANPRPPVVPAWPAVPNIAEHRDRGWQTPCHGEIVCHCELVTREEIEAALASPVPPGDFGGLKRRTRAGMGRCQGFYCGARLAEMTHGRFAAPLAVGAVGE
jgi:glycerol-3-phosphate dehydrogenase